VTSAPLGSTSMPAMPSSASTTFFIDLAGDYALTVTVTDDEGSEASCVVTFSTVVPEDLHVELSWTAIDDDFDLHLLPPAGVVPDDWWVVTGADGTERDCHWLNPSASWPPPGSASDGSLDLDDEFGPAVEVINIDTMPSNGTYKIGVHYWCNRAPNEPTVVNVRVYCRGVLEGEWDVPMDESGRFTHVANVSWPLCNTTFVNDASWASLTDAPLPLPGGFDDFDAPHCDRNCDESSDCPPGEVCDGGECTCLHPSATCGVP